VVAEVVILHHRAGSLAWLLPVLVAAGAGTAFVLAASGDRALRRGALAVAVAALLVAPATWSVQTLEHATNGTFPAGGPATAQAAGPGGGGGTAPGGAASEYLTQALAYVRSHGGGTLAISSQSGALGSPPLESVRTQRIFPEATASASHVAVTWLSRPEKPPSAATSVPDETSCAAPDWLEIASVPPPWPRT
jgi:hypothetical protein